MKQRSKTRLRTTGGIGLLISLASCPLFGDSIPIVDTEGAQPRGVDSTINVEFDQQQGAAKPAGVGFLLLGPGIDPPDQMIQPLNPGLWRMHLLDTVRHARITGFGAKYQFIMSDSWGYPSDPFGWPYESALGNEPYYWWVQYCLNQAQAALSANLEIEWDVWNEPDLGSFWQGTRQQLFTTYFWAHEAIRSVIPDAVIGGPSIANAQMYVTWQDSLDFLTEFLDFCVANNIEANFISWHENNDFDVFDIESHIQDVRALVELPVYASVNVQKIYVNETIGGAGHYSPGHSIVTFDMLEGGGVDGAIKSCFPRWTSPGDNCLNRSLNGLLTPAGYVPQGDYLPVGAWWAFKYYAEMTGQWVLTTSSNPAMAAVAATDGDRFEALVGYSGPAAITLGQFTAQDTIVLFNGLAGPGQCDAEFTLLGIPNTNEAPLDAPVVYYDAAPVTIEDGQVSLQIPSYVSDNAFYVLIENINPSCAASAVPAVSAWGLVAMVMSLLVFSSVVLARRSEPC